MASVLYKGIRESAFINNLIVMVKISIILAFIGLGWMVMDSANWVANSDATGLARLVPPQIFAMKNGREVLSFGWPGVLTGAGVVFFAYLGFDAVSTTAQECKNPSRDLPIGILVSVIFCTILYILMALVITGVVPYSELGVPDPVAVGVDRIVALYGWSPIAQKIVTFAVKVGALAGLTSVVLVQMMGQTRIFFAMSRDGLLPWFHRVHPKYSTPHVATVVTGLVVAVVGGAFPIAVIGELVSIGTLLAFVLVCVGIPILRFTNPDTPRPFKTPFYWFVAPAGAIACIWVMSGLPQDTWTRLIVWLLLGFAIYFGYGAKRSKLRIKNIHFKESALASSVSSQKTRT
jgi:APA family basic amino acid/polyamine antiporter